MVYGSSLPWLTPVLWAGFHLTRVSLAILMVVALVHALRRVHSGTIFRLRSRRVPDVLAAVALLLAVWFVVRVQDYLHDLATVPLTTRILAVDRFFSLDSLLSPQLQLAALLALLFLWVTWSLRTLYYQC
ncbi:hypothetical protein, partial [Enterococcus faecalis]|uniref:hypothetical protein n=1 Tax=Enterococcus faecalis TaxID=1351 RepID=UPI0011776B9B